MSPITCADKLVSIIKERGINHVFSLSGTSLLELYRALSNNRDIKLVIARHEESAAFMANGYGWAKKEPGICITSRSPGAANTVIAVQNAYQSSTPLINIVGSSNILTKGKEGFGEVDLVSLFKPITKWSSEVLIPDTLSQTINRAFHVAKSGRPGPVMISIPHGIQKALLEKDTSITITDIQKSSPSQESINKATKFLSDAKYPVILVGGGVLASEASLEVLKIAEVLSAPVITSWMKNDIIPNDSLYYLGSLGPGTSEVTGSIIKNADVVLAVGFRFSESSTNGYTLPPSSAKIIQLDIEQDQIGCIMDVEIGLVGDAKLGLKKLINTIKANFSNISNRKDSDYLKRSKRLLDKSNDLICSNMDGEITSSKAMIAIKNELENKDISFVLDGGAFLFWFLRYFKFYIPKTLLGPSGSGAMGFGLPSAVGVSLARPGKPVVNIAGDGGFIMTMHELDTAIRLKLPIINIIWNNDCYGSIYNKQKSSYKGIYGTKIASPDFVKIASAYGASAERVINITQFKVAIERALKSDMPSVIDLKVSLSEMIPPNSLKRIES